MNIKNSNSREGTPMRTFTKLIAAASVLAILGGCAYGGSINAEDTKAAETQLVGGAAIAAEEREERNAEDRRKRAARQRFVRGLDSTNCLIADPDIFAASADGLADTSYVNRYRSEKLVEHRRLRLGKIAEVEGVYGSNNGNSGGGDSGGGGASGGGSRC